MMRLMPTPAPMLRLLVLGSLWLAAASLGPRAAAAENEPFESVRLAVAGRPVEVWTGSFSGNCEQGAQDMLVIAIEGVPPREQRRVLHFPCQAGERLNPQAGREFAVPGDAVAVDAYGPHSELAFLRPSGLQLVSLADPEKHREIHVPGGLPLVPRSRGLSRMPLVGPWGAQGRPGALLPTLTGALAVDLEDGSQRSIELPMMADYETQAPGLPNPVDHFMLERAAWPLLLPGDDDGDGRTDLFALTRWNLAVLRAGEEGLAQQPSRLVELRPFEDRHEIRPEQSGTTYRATDLNADGLTDLVLHRSWGSMMRGRGITSVFFNAGEGARPDASPDVLREREDGFSTIEFLDLDGDGWFEGVETSMDFGLVQAVRMLLTRRGKATVEILTLEREPPHRLVSSWKQDIRFKIDFGEARIEGLFPVLDTDWNADGRNDLLYMESDGEIALRLGKAGARGPSFGNRVAGQSSPFRAGRSASADLDGDGLEDLILYDPQASVGAVWVYYNRGQLPGSPAP